MGVEKMSKLDKFTKNEIEWHDVVEHEKGYLFDATQGFEKIKEAFENINKLHEDFMHLEWYFNTETDNRPRIMSIGYYLEEKQFKNVQDVKDVLLNGNNDPEFLEWQRLCKERMIAETRLEVAELEEKQHEIKKQLASKKAILERWE